MKLILALFLGSLSYSCCTAEIPKAVVIPKPNWPLVFRGEHISLTCDIQGQPPGGDRGYRWFRDNQPLGRTSENNDISLGQVDKSFNNSLYKCVVIRGTQRPHLESEPYKIHVLEIPRATITIQSPQQPFYSGDRVILRCDITQGLGWKYIWERNNTWIQRSVSETITLSLPEESGHYQCYGIRGQLTTFAATISVVISASPTATLTVEPQSPVFTGETVTLKCVIESLSGWTYKWFKDNMSEPVNMTVERKITITAAAKSDEGQYWCQAERKDRPTSSERSNAVHIQVKALPTSKLTTQPKTPVYTGENVTLICEIEPQRGWTYKWYKDNSFEPVATSVTKTTTINNAAYSDEGQYWCQGERRDRPTASQPSEKVHLHIKTPVSDSSSFILIAVGVVVGMFFLAFLVFCLHRSKYLTGLCVTTAAIDQQQQQQQQMSTNQSSDQDQSQSAGRGGSESEYMPLQNRTTDVYDTITPLYMPLQRGATDVYETIKSSKDSQEDDEEGYDDVVPSDTRAEEHV